MASASLVPTSASAAPAHTDVMFVFDTTGSMGGAIEEAKTEIQEAMTDIRSQLPDVQFGLAEMKDYTEVTNGSFEYDQEDAGRGFQPWTLESPVTSNEASVTGLLSGLTADGGGDGPEAYGRALFETATNPSVGWRAGARGVIVLVADNVPHDNELNEGIASPPIESPFETGIDPGRDITVGTADDLDWQSTVLPTLVGLGKPLEFVDYHGQPEYLPYWQNWTARTGGRALEAGGGGLASELTAAVLDGANAPLPPCPAGTTRDATERCVIGASVSATIPPPPAPATTCPTYEVFDSRGSGEPSGTSKPGKKFIAAFEQRLGLHQPSGVSVHNNLYPAVGVIGKHWPDDLNGLGAVFGVHDLGAYRDSENEGRKEVLSFLRTELAGHCGKKSKIVLLGYSQGAQATGDAYEQIYAGLTKEQRNHIAAVVLWGDPRYNHTDHLADRDDRSTDGLLGTRKPFPNEAKEAKESKVFSYCNKRDIICQTFHLAEMVYYRTREHDLYWKTDEAKNDGSAVASFLAKGGR